VSDKNKTIARAALEAFGGKPKPEVSRYWDEKNESFVDILVCQDRPDKGVHSVSTIGLSDHPLFEGGREYRDGEGYLVRPEIVGACYKEVKEFPNILATAAFYVINSKWFCAPGAIFPNMVKMYLPRVRTKHLMFYPPVLWEESLKTIQFDELKVAWLMAVPISESEYRFAIDNTLHELEGLLAEHEIDVFDLNRKSVV
jgi:antitoxin YqcF